VAPYAHLDRAVLGEDRGALKVNTTADGFFHAATWVAVVVGLVLLWRATRGALTLTWRSLFGLMLAGWGLFNLVEGIVDHHILQIHHVRPGENALGWDLGFLALGVVLVITGLAMYRKDRDRVSRAGSTRRSDGLRGSAAEGLSGRRWCCASG